MTNCSHSRLTPIRQPAFVVLSALLLVSFGFSCVSYASDPRLKVKQGNCVTRALGKLVDLPYLVPKQVTAEMDRATAATLKAAIDSIFDNFLLSLKQKNRKAFELYLEVRLRNESALTKRTVEDFLTRYRPGAYFKATAFEVVVPEEVFDDIFVLQTVAHEVEHNIHTTALWGIDSERDGAVDKLKLIYHALLSPRSRYVTETGAMKAEWEFLQFIPDSDLLVAQERIKGSRMSPSEKAHMLSKLTSSRLPLDQYLAGQRGKFRYDGLTTPLITPSSIPLLVLGNIYVSYCILRPHSAYCPDISPFNGRSSARP